MFAVPLCEQPEKAKLSIPPLKPERGLVQLYDSLKVQISNATADAVRGISKLFAGAEKNIAHAQKMFWNHLFSGLHSCKEWSNKVYNHIFTSRSIHPAKKTEIDTTTPVTSDDEKPQLAATLSHEKQGQKSEPGRRHQAASNIHSKPILLSVKPKVASLVMAPKTAKKDVDFGLEKADRFSLFADKKCRQTCPTSPEKTNTHSQNEPVDSPTFDSSLTLK